MKVTSLLTVGLLVAATGVLAEETPASPPVPAPPTQINPDQTITISVKKLEKLLSAQKLQHEVEGILAEIQAQIKVSPAPQAAPKKK